MAKPLVHSRCLICGIDFEYAMPAHMVSKRQVCSKECRDERNRRYARRHYLRSKGLNPHEIEDAMRHHHKRTSVTVDGDFDDKTLRRCKWHLIGDEDGAEVHCITILCRYNPGPFCFIHASMIEDRAMADMIRRVERVRAVDYNEYLAIMQEAS